MDIDEPPVPLPCAAAREISTGVLLQPPLSRRGHGPGLIIILPQNLELDENQQTLDPPPLLKWAEEGYAVVKIQLSNRADEQRLSDAIRIGVDALTGLQECDVKDKFGLVLYDSRLVKPIDAANLALFPFAGIVTHGSAMLTDIPQLTHSPCKKEMNPPSSGADVRVYEYAETSSPYFVVPKHNEFLASAAAVAHTRSLTFLKSKLGGPNFDLEAIWEEHTYFEFEDRSVAKTMGTMVQEPYVNHIPTLTGGIGRGRLTNFYRHHFIWNNPKDTKLELISRTVGIDRIVDEFIFCFTHDEKVDWLYFSLTPSLVHRLALTFGYSIPGIPPTGKAVRLPMVSVVNVRGDRLYHEHIWWDQACCLRQLGLLPEYLPFPYRLPDGRVPQDGKRFEYRVPVAGEESAAKLVDQHSAESNEMFDFGLREI